MVQLQESEVEYVGVYPALTAWYFESVLFSMNINVKMSLQWNFSPSYFSADSWQ